MAKGRIVRYEEPARRAPERSVYTGRARRRRRRRGRGLLFALAALVLASAAAFVVWHACAGPGAGRAQTEGDEAALPGWPPRRTAASWWPSTRGTAG